MLRHASRVQPSRLVERAETAPAAPLDPGFDTPRETRSRTASSGARGPEVGAPRIDGRGSWSRIDGMVFVRGDAMRSGFFGFTLGMGVVSLAGAFAFGCDS